MRLLTADTLVGTASDPHQWLSLTRYFDTSPHVMASDLRDFGRVTSGNRRRHGETNPETRAAIIAWVNAGQTRRVVGERFGVHYTAVGKIIKVFNETHSLTAKPRSGRPKANFDRKRMQIHSMVVIRWIARDKTSFQRPRRK